MPAPVFVLGGFQSDFARNLAREGRELVDLVGEVVDGALAAAGVEAGDVDAIHVGNAFGELFTGQAHLGAMPATARTRRCGGSPPCATRARARRAQWRSSPRWPRSRPAATTARSCWASSRSATSPASRRPAHGRRGPRRPRGPRRRFLWPAHVRPHRRRLRRAPRPRAASTSPRSPRRTSPTRAQPERPDPRLALRRRRLRPLGRRAVNPLVEGRLRRHDCSQVTDGAPR
jgi:acetyl-CoA C-acetyltransferase